MTLVLELKLKQGDTELENEPPCGYPSDFQIKEVKILYFKNFPNSI